MAPAGGYCYSGDVEEEVGSVTTKKQGGGEEGKKKKDESGVTVRSSEVSR